MRLRCYSKTLFDLLKSCISEENIWIKYFLLAERLYIKKGKRSVARRTVARGHLLIWTFVRVDNYSKRTHARYEV